MPRTSRHRAREPSRVNPHRYTNDELPSSGFFLGNRGFTSTKMGDAAAGVVRRAAPAAWACSAATARGSITAVAEPTREPADGDNELRDVMAAERTWLAWWRTALV